MPRHDPESPPSRDAVPAGRRLSAAVTPAVRGAEDFGPASPGDSTVSGLLSGPPGAGRAADQRVQGQADAPASRGPRLRWRTGRRAATLLCLVAMALLGCFWWQASNTATQVSPLGAVSTAEPGAEPAPGLGTEPAPEVGTGPATELGTGLGTGPVSADRITVHVAGAVVHAGIVELPSGSRLHEAISAAGGGAPDADPGQLNLAAVVEDGQKVVVPRQGESTGPAGAAAAGAAGAAAGPDSPGGLPPPGGKINLNTAGVDELETLPRVGPVLARRIVEWRSQHGRFERVEELDAVDGVGAKMLAALLPLLRV